jgi:hypothetical protein
MVKTERATEATGSASRSHAAAAVASRRNRVSRYATVAKMAAAIPAVAFASGADGAIYSRTDLSITVSAAQGLGGGPYFDTKITGAGGATVATLYAGRIGAGGAGNTRSFASINIFNGTTYANFRSKGINPAGAGGPFRAGFVAAANATWNMAGPTTSSSFAPLWFGGATGGVWNDPQGLSGSGGQTRYLLFQFTDGAAAGNYGWVSFVTSNTIEYQNGSITITGWGWGDDGNPIAAGFTGTAVPGGTGLAALAFGAAALRGRRRSRS